VRGVCPGVFETQTVLAPDIDTVIGASHSIEARGVDQDVEFVFLLCGFYAVGSDAVDWLIHEGID
jgi:hypothetical protein